MMQIRIVAVRPGRAINALFVAGCEVYSPVPSDDISLVCTVPLKDKSRVYAEVEKIGGEITVIRQWGLPVIFGRYRHRYGIAAGLVLFTAVIIASGSFVWRVDISGSRSGSPDSYKDTIREAGLGVGSCIYGLEINEIQHRCVLLDSRIAWISLNRIGTVVSAEIKEAVNEEENDNAPANIVAAFDGQIESIEVRNGVGTVVIGETVKKGDLLISGVVEDAVEGIKTLSADGVVTARVNTPIRVEIPFETEEKVYTGRVKRKKTLFFFGNSINLFINYGNYTDKYDTMVCRKNIQLYDGTDLPINIKETIYSEYETVKRTLTPDEAVSRALSEMQSVTREILKDACLVSREQKAYFTDDSFVIESEITVLIDIAEKLPIG